MLQHDCIKKYILNGEKSKVLKNTPGKMLYLNVMTIQRRLKLEFGKEYPLGILDFPIMMTFFSYCALLNIALGQHYAS